MLICTKCWNNNCNHYKVEIDDSIVDVIIALNKNGYKTSFCCGGHENEPYAYISFNRFNKVKPDFSYLLDKGWKYVKSSRTLYYMKNKTEDANEQVERARKELGEWLEQL